jgi:hypothetical protein
MGPIAKDPTLNRFDAAGFDGYRLLDQGNDQWLYTFENGYGASVVKGPYTYGGPEGFYELAVLHPDSLCYRTEITNDVIGWLDEAKVLSTLDAIRELAPVDGCDHNGLWGDR